MNNESVISLLASFCKVAGRAISSAGIDRLFTCELLCSKSAKGRKGRITERHRGHSCHDTYLGLLKVMNLVELSFEQIGEFLLICQANTYSVEPLRPF